MNPEASTKSAGPQVLEAVGLLADRLGIVVPPYRFPVLSAELERIGGAGGLDEGLSRLQLGDDGAWTEIITVTAIPETYFFRHHGHFSVLLEHGRNLAIAGRPCRVLCAGCSTGEEVWSAAAVLATLPNTGGAHHHVTGWDLSEHRLRVASRARYRSWSCRRGFEGYGRFFQQIDEQWHVVAELKRLTDFRCVNLVRDRVPAGVFDVIFFRNVSIYWEQSTVDHVTEHLVNHLAGDGLLMVGPSDPVNLPPRAWRQDFRHDARVYDRRHETPEVAKSTASSPRTGSVPTREDRPLSRTRHPSRRTASRPSSVHSAETPQSARTLVTAMQNDDLFDRIRDLANNGDYQTALDELSANTTEITPQNTLWEGILLLNLGRQSDAVVSLRKSVFLEPEEPSYRRWLAVAYEATGRDREAARENHNASRLEDR